jgi:hypothetical protein
MDGKVKDKYATVNGVCEDVDDFINNVLLIGYNLIKKGVDCEKIVLKTSKRLNEKLKDTPENKLVWERIYKEIPTCIMHHTFRMENIDDGDDTSIIVFTDFNSKGGKEQSKSIKRQLKEFGF